MGMEINVLIIRIIFIAFCFIRDTERKETEITGTAISSESDSSDVKKTERRVHFLGYVYNCIKGILFFHWKHQLFIPHSPITRSMSQQSSKSGSAKGNKNSSVPSSSGSETSGVKRQRIKLEHSYVYDYLFFFLCRFFEHCYILAQHPELPKEKRNR